MKNNSYSSNKLNFCLKSKINKDYLNYENVLNYEGYEGYEELWYCSYCDKEFLENNRNIYNLYF